MPFVEVKTNVPLSDGARDELLRNVAAVVSDLLGRPAADVLASFAPSALLLAGSGAPAALVQLRCVMTPGQDAARAFCDGIAELLRARLGVPPERLFVEIVAVPPPTAWRFVAGAAVSAVAQERA